MFDLSIETQLSCLIFVLMLNELTLMMLVCGHSRLRRMIENACSGIGEIKIDIVRDGEPGSNPSVRVSESVKSSGEASEKPVKVEGAR